MKKIFFLIPVFVFAAFFFFQKSNTPIADPTDYDFYLNPEHLQKNLQEINSQINFWENKLNEGPENFVYQKKLAGLFSKKFKISGEAEYLNRSDSLFKLVNKKIPGQVGVLQSLAMNAISRHVFREAEKHIFEAYEIGEKKFASSLILSDVLMERGQLFDANQLLQDVASKEHFDYLIRAMKMQDEIDNLPKAIELMEQALKKAKQTNNPALINWSLSNLADMYGHNGQVRKSYQTYLKALSFNPADLHSLKGIAWVAYANDKNTTEAKRILNYLKSIHPVPDYNLLLAEIAFFENKKELAEKYEAAFIAEASQPKYGNMYKSYLAELYAEKNNQKINALSIAKAEVEERPHPTSYALLAWTEFQNGNLKEAIQITENRVLLQTGEPNAVFHSAIILKEAGQYEKAKKYLQASLESGYELGPAAVQEIQSHLREMDRSQLASLDFNNALEMRMIR